MAARRRGAGGAWATVALAGALVLTGCSGADEDPPPAGTAQQGSSSGEPSEGGGSGGAGVEDSDLEDVLVEQVVAQPDDPDDRATVGVRSLRVEGDVMVLELVVTPDFASVSDSDTVSLFDVFERVQGTFAPTLLDRVNLKRYSPVSGGPGRAFTSDAVRTSALSGRPMRAYAVYAAPEDDIEAIDVVLADVWPAFTDVPIER
jgi:hypothetical protein